ncbi:hypothetical protein BD779DRAFT_349310 [Infundibulicybe gibba]|nr:hypothetical protein BD779DRAFT_349310 [Infundibulicybe gibba]
MERAGVQSCPSDEGSQGTAWYGTRAPGPQEQAAHCRTRTTPVMHAHTNFSKAIPRVVIIHICINLGRSPGGGHCCNMLAPGLCIACRASRGAGNKRGPTDTPRLQAPPPPTHLHPGHRLLPHRLTGTPSTTKLPHIPTSTPPRPPDPRTVDRSKSLHHPTSLFPPTLPTPSRERPATSKLELCLSPPSFPSHPSAAMSRSPNLRLHSPTGTVPPPPRLARRRVKSSTAVAYLKNDCGAAGEPAGAHRAIRGRGGYHAPWVRQGERGSCMARVRPLGARRETKKRKRGICAARKGGEGGEQGGLDPFQWPCTEVAGWEVICL